MKQARWGRVLLAAGIVASVQVARAGEPPTIAALKAESAEALKGAEGMAYVTLIAKTLQETFSTAMEKCEPALKDPMSMTFEIGFRITVEGRTVDVVTNPATEAGKCVAGQFRAVQYPKPPYPRFPIYLAVKGAD